MSLSGHAEEEDRRTWSSAIPSSTRAHDLADHSRARHIRFRRRVPLGRDGMHRRRNAARELRKNVAAASRADLTERMASPRNAAMRSMTTRLPSDGRAVESPQSSCGSGGRLFVAAPPELPIGPSAWAFKAAESTVCPAVPADCSQCRPGRQSTKWSADSVINRSGRPPPDEGPHLH